MSPDLKQKMKKVLSKSLVLLIVLTLLTGCATNPKCVEVREWMEKEGYLADWTYVKDIVSLDDTPNPQGRYLFALYESNATDGQYAVLRVLACTDGAFDADFIEAEFDKATDTAETIKGIDRSVPLLSKEFVFDDSKIKEKSQKE